MPEPRSRGLARLHLPAQLCDQLPNEFSSTADGNNCLQGVVCLTARRSQGDTLVDRKLPETELRVSSMLGAFIAERPGAEIFSNLRL